MEPNRETLLEVNHLDITYGSGKKAFRAVQGHPLPLSAGRLRRTFP